MLIHTPSIILCIVRNDKLYFKTMQAKENLEKRDC